VDTKEINRIGHIVNINNVQWRVAEKRFKYGREWVYTLSREMVDGTYESMQLNEGALESMIKSGSKVNDSTR
jgi:hypothetical protein